MCAVLYLGNVPKRRGKDGEVRASVSPSPCVYADHSSGKRLAEMCSLMDKPRHFRPDDSASSSNAINRNRLDLEQRLAMELACAEATRTRANAEYVQAQARVVKLMVAHKQSGVSEPVFAEPVQQAMDAAHEAMTVLLRAMEDLRVLQEKHRRVLAKHATNHAGRN